MSQANSARHRRIFDAIAGLVEKSLIATRIDETQAQYRLLDTTRAYALEKLEEHAEVDVVFRRHAEYVANTSNRKERCCRLCQGLKELRLQRIPANSVTSVRRWNGALGRTVTTRSRRDLRPLQRSCFWSCPC
jgi:plasmid stabilization system protein ParE